MQNAAQAEYTRLAAFATYSGLGSEIPAPAKLAPVCQSNVTAPPATSTGSLLGPAKARQREPAHPKRPLTEAGLWHFQPMIFVDTTNKPKTTPVTARKAVNYQMRCMRRYPPRAGSVDVDLVQREVKRRGALTGGGGAARLSTWRLQLKRRLYCRLLHAHPRQIFSDAALADQ
jgi:hypothetical protein